MNADAVADNGDAEEAAAAAAAAAEDRASMVVGDLGDPEEAPGLKVAALPPPLGLPLPPALRLPLGLQPGLLLSLLSFDDDGLILPKIFLRDLVPEKRCRPRVTAARRSARDFLLEEEEEDDDDAAFLLLLLLLLLLVAVIICRSEAVGVETLLPVVTLEDTTGALVMVALPPLGLLVLEVAAATMGDATPGLEVARAALPAAGELLPPPPVVVAAEARVSTSIGPGILCSGDDFGTDPPSFSVLFSPPTVIAPRSATAAGSTAATLRLLIWKTISPSSEESSS